MENTMRKKKKNLKRTTEANAQQRPDRIESLRTAELLQTLKTRETAPIEAYTSKYAERIDRLLDDSLSRGEFSYDAASDPLYKQYRDAYTLAGRRAMQDSAGQAAALTGGYGSSYATSAAAQAGSEYMTKLSGILPELDQRAYDRWKDAGEANARGIALAADLDETDYARYRDRVDDVRDALDYYAARYDASRKADTEDWRARSDDYESDRDYERDIALDAEDARRWQTELDYDRERDIALDAEDARRWQTELDYDRERDLAADRQWQAEFDRLSELDAVDQARWEAEHKPKITGGKSSSGSTSTYQQRAKAILGSQGNMEACAYLRSLQNQGLISAETVDRIVAAIGADMSAYIVAQKKKMFSETKDRKQESLLAAFRKE